MPCEEDVNNLTAYFRTIVGLFRYLMKEDVALGCVSVKRMLML